MQEENRARRHSICRRAPESLSACGLPLGVEGSEPRAKALGSPFLPGNAAIVRDRRAAGSAPRLERSEE